MANIEIRLIPFGPQPSKKVNQYEVAASGSNYKEVLGNLVAAINADEVDTENNELIIVDDTE